MCVVVKIKHRRGGLRLLFKGRVGAIVNLLLLFDSHLESPLLELAKNKLEVVFSSELCDEAAS